MSQNKETQALVLTLLVTLGILGVGIFWVKNLVIDGSPVKKK